MLECANLLGGQKTKTCSLYIPPTFLRCRDSRFDFYQRLDFGPNTKPHLCFCRLHADTVINFATCVLMANARRFLQGLVVCQHGHTAPRCHDSSSRERHVNRRNCDLVETKLQSCGTGHRRRRNGYSRPSLVHQSQYRIPGLRHPGQYFSAFQLH